MSFNASQLLEQSNAIMAKLYPDKEALSALGLTSEVWQEGGEWYPYNDKYSDITVGDKLRGLRDTQFVKSSDVSMVVPSIEQAFASVDQFAVSLGCGAGKSTSLIAKLHALKLAKHTLVLEPSLITARGIAQYCLDKGYQCESKSKIRSMPSQRSCMYTSVACFVDGFMSGCQYDDVLLVLDEAHCVTFPYLLAYEILDRLPVKVLLMSASTSDTVVGIKGARVTQVSSKEPTIPTAELSADLAKHRELAVVVGIMNNTVATPANLLIGATFAIRTIFDTGLRVDPVVVDGRVEFGERQATRSEVIQMVGRVARTGSSGRAYYVDNAKTLRTRHPSLYDTLYGAYAVLLGIESGDKSLASRLLLSKGLDSAAVDTLTSSEGDKVERRVSFEADETCPASVEHVDYEDRRQAFRDRRADRFLRGADVGDSSSSGDEYEPISSKSSTVPTTPEGSDDELGHVLTKRERSLIAKFGGSPSSVSLDLGAVRRDVDKMIRPFSRGAVSMSREVVSKYGVVEIMYALALVADRGGSIYPEPLRVVSENDVSSADVKEARLVLSGNVLPSYSEAEMTSVLVCWDRLAVHSIGRVADCHMNQFTKYFMEYGRYAEAYPGKVLSR